MRGNYDRTFISDVTLVNAPSCATCVPTKKVTARTRADSVETSADGCRYLWRERRPRVHPGVVSLPRHR